MTTLLWAVVAITAGLVIWQIVQDRKAKAKKNDPVYKIRPSTKTDPKITEFQERPRSMGMPPSPHLPPKKPKE